MYSVADRVFCDALDLPAEPADGGRGLVGLLLCHRALHREKLSAHLHIWQTQLRQYIQPRNRAGDSRVVLLAASGNIFLRAPGDDLGVHTKLRQNGLQPAHPLAERVEQRQADGRLRDLQRHAGKARAAADVDDRPASEICQREQCHAVHKVQPRDGARLGDGGQVHDLVLFEQSLTKTAEGLDLPLGEGERGLMLQNFSHSVTSG